MNYAGRKTALLPDLFALFPPDFRIFIDLFVGTGSVTFEAAKRPGRVVFANDVNDEIANLWAVLSSPQYQDVLDLMELIPIHETILKGWKTQEGRPVYRAVKFLYRLQYSMVGKGYTLRGGISSDPRKTLRDELIAALAVIKNCKFFHGDFRDVFRKISFRDDYTGESNREATFVYGDPPYYNTEQVWKQAKFTGQDLYDLFALLNAQQMPCGISESDHPHVRDVATKFGFTAHVVCTRRSVKKEITEMLYTKYYTPMSQQPQLF